MADWNDILAAFEKDKKKKDEDIFFENEQKLHKSISIYLCAQKGVSPLQGYKPDELVQFLNKPSQEIKQCLGGEWLEMSDEQFDMLCYSLKKKTQKSAGLLAW